VSIQSVHCGKMSQVAHHHCRVESQLCLACVLFIHGLCSVVRADQTWWP
jgi:hypothetical protein